MGAKRQDGDARAFADDTALTNFKRETFGRHLNPHPVAARIPERDRPGVMCGGGGNHVNEFGFICGGHHHHTRQVGQESHVKRPSVGGAISPNQTGTVDGEADRQALDRHVMHDLIVAALQERRIDRAERLHAACSQTRRKSHRVLLGNPHVKHPLGEAAREQIQPGSIRHGGGNGDDFAVGFRLPDQCLGENSGVRRRIGGRFFLLPGHHIKLGAGVALVGCKLGRSVPFALFGDHMDQGRASGAGFHGAQYRQKLVHVVAVNRADVGKPQLLKQGAADRHAFQHFLGATGALLQRFRQKADHAFGSLLDFLKRRTGI